MRCLLTMLAVAKALQRALPRAHARRRVISMGLKTGIVGLPNVGKSTLYNTLVFEHFVTPFLMCCHCTKK